MNNKPSFKLIIILFIIFAAFAAIFSISRLNIRNKPSEKPLTPPAPKLEYGALSQNETYLDFTLEYNLNKKTKEQIAEFRKNKVKEYGFLNIYPLNYDPLKPPHSSIYNSITDGEDWMDHSAFYVANPYYLIGTACAGTISDFGVRASDYPGVKYSHGKILVEYRRVAALKWLYCAFNGPGEKSLISLIGVNALDSGFSWGYLDKTQSANIDLNRKTSSTNIINAPHKFQGFYHVGQYKKNNLSPYDADAAIKIENKEKPVCLTLKLWKDEPKDINVKEDLLYVISVTP